jgi:hypothetical protein
MTLLLPESGGDYEEWTQVLTSYWRDHGEPGRS